MQVTVGASGRDLLETPQQVWRGEAEGELITALFAGKQMWVETSDPDEERQTFRLTYLDFKSEPLLSLEAAKDAKQWDGTVCRCQPFESTDLGRDENPPIHVG